MATSRTGTARYRTARRAALNNAQANNLTHCPCALPTCKHHAPNVCGVPLDYERTRKPNSAEPDHITPAAHGGPDTPANLARIVCRRCNQSRGAKPLTPETTTQPPPTTTQLIAW